MSLYAQRQCVSAVTLPDPWMLAQCALDQGHDGDHKALIEWDDDDMDDLPSIGCNYCGVALSDGEPHLCHEPGGSES